MVAAMNEHLSTSSATSGARTSSSTAVNSSPAGGANSSSTIGNSNNCPRDFQVDEDGGKAAAGILSFPCDFDHMYASMTDGGAPTAATAAAAAAAATSALGVSPLRGNEPRQNDLSEVKHLKELLLLHLDLIQQQSEQIVTKDKLLAALRQENETLKLRLERMDRRVNLQKFRSENNENSIVSEHLVGACSPPTGNSANQTPSTSEFQRSVHSENSNLQFNETFKIRLNTSGGITTVKQELNDNQGKYDIKQEAASGGDCESTVVDASAAASSDCGIGNGSNTSSSTSSGAGGYGGVSNVSVASANAGDNVACSNSGGSSGGGGGGGEGTSGTGESRFEWEERKKRRSDPSLLINSGGAAGVGGGSSSISCDGSIGGGGGKRKRGLSCSSTVSNDTSSTVGHDKTSNHEVGRKAERKGKSLVKKESFLTTEEHYFTAVGDPAYTLNLKESSPVETNGAQLEVPNWRVKIYTSCYTMEGTENLDDEIFNKRHLKLENDERRRKRWDVQRIREQRHIEKLKQRQERQNHQATCYNTNHTGPCPSATEEETVMSLWPDVDHIQSLQVDSQLPVTAFGAPIPSFTPSEFSLPWSSTVRSKSRRPKRSTARRKSSRR